MVVKRIGPLSVGKIAGTLYAVMGVLIGAVVSLIAMAGEATQGVGFGEAVEGLQFNKAVAQLAALF